MHASVPSNASNPSLMPASPRKSKELSCQAYFDPNSEFAANVLPLLENSKRIKIISKYMRDKTLSDSLWHGELSIVLLIRCCDLQKINFSFIGCLRTSGEEVQNHNQPPKLLNSMATSFSAILTQNTHFWQRLSTGKLDDHHLLEGTIWAIIFVLVIFLLVYRTYLYFWGLTFRAAHSCCES